MWDEFWFGVFPYLVVALFFGVPIYRAYHGKLSWTARGDFAWTTRASGFFESRWMAIGSWSLHAGIIVLFAGHILGLVGGHYGDADTLEVFHWSGLAAGLLFLYGLGVALARRLLIPEMRAMSLREDYVILILLMAITSLALYQVILKETFGVSLSVAPWLVSLAKLSPEVGLIATAPTVTKIHMGLAMAFFAYFPFTKMVHVWSFPFEYLFRPFIAIRRYGRWAK